jgi:hypothetical protein
MAHEDTIYAVMESLVIADKHVIGDIMAHKGLWTKGTSAVNNSYKALNCLVDSGKLVKGDGYFKLPDCKSDYKEHSQLLSKALAEIIKFNPTCKIFREHTITEKGLRPDGIVLLTRDDQACCFILEVCNNESEDYLTQKINTWNAWDGANKYLSDLFGEDIPFFQIVVSDNLKTFMEEL